VAATQKWLQLRSGCNWNSVQIPMDLLVKWNITKQTFDEKYFFQGKALGMLLM